MIKKGLLSAFYIFWLSILSCGSFYNINVSYASSETGIQSTAEQPGHYNLLLDGLAGNPLVVDEEDGRNVFDNPVNLIYPEDQTTCYNIVGKKLWFMGFWTGAPNPYWHYHNQSGSNRSLPVAGGDIFTLNGKSVKLRTGNITAGDTCASNIYYPNTDRLWFVVITDEDLSYINTEAEVYQYMDILNARYFAEKYGTDLIMGVLAINNPVNLGTEASTTINFNFDYLNSGIGSTTADIYKIRLFDSISNLLAYEFTGSLPSGEMGNISVDQIIPVAGTYRLDISLFNTTEDYYMGMAKQLTFSVLNNSYMDNIVGLSDPNNWANLLGLATTTCDIYNISGCFQNALIFAFFPSSTTTFNGFIDLKNELQKKYPFGYVSVVGGQLLRLSASGGGSLTSDENISDLIFTPLRAGLSIILWIAFALSMFNRVRKFEL